MDKQSASAGTTGIGAFGLLGVILVTLKVLGKITLSWMWCLFPFVAWIFILIAICAAAMLFYLVAIIFTGVAAVFLDRKKRTLP